MTVLLPGMTEEDQRVKISSVDTTQQGLLDSWKTKVWHLKLVFLSLVSAKLGDEWFVTRQALNWITSKTSRNNPSFHPHTSRTWTTSSSYTTKRPYGTTIPNRTCWISTVEWLKSLSRISNWCTIPIQSTLSCNSVAPPRTCSPWIFVIHCVQCKHSQSLWAVSMANWLANSRRETFQRWSSMHLMTAICVTDIPTNDLDDDSRPKFAHYIVNWRRVFVRLCLFEFSGN